MRNSAGGGARTSGAERVSDGLHCLKGDHHLHLLCASALFSEVVLPVCQYEINK